MLIHAADVADVINSSERYNVGSTIGEVRALECVGKAILFPLIQPPPHFSLPKSNLVLLTVLVQVAWEELITRVSENSDNTSNSISSMFSSALAGFVAPHAELALLLVSLPPPPPLFVFCNSHPRLDH